MTIEVTARELRRLTAERDRGELPPSDYRRRRGEILDQLVGLAPRADCDVTRPRAAEEPMPRPAAAVAAPALPATTSAARARGGRVWLLVTFVTLLGAGGGIALWEYSARLPAAPVPAPLVATAASVPRESGRPSPVDAFLVRGDWTDPAVSALNSAWWSMSDDEIVAALTSDSAHRIAEGVAARLREHVPGGGGPPLDPDSPLVLLARNLNVAVPTAAVGARLAAADEALWPGSPRKDAKDASARSASVNSPTSALAPAAAANDARGAASALPPVAAVVKDAAITHPLAPAAPSLVTTAADPCAAFYTNPKRRRCRDDLPDGRPAPDLVVLPQGRFLMGSTFTPEEQPVRDVVILRPFAMTVAEITVGQFRAFCDATSRSCQIGGRDGAPVTRVSWDDARDYARWLTESTGRRYRLPSESEWEYAARADSVGEPGREFPVLNPNTDARFAASGAPAPSGPVDAADPTFRVNSFGLRHMLGNVREWVQDGWLPGYQKAPPDAAVREALGNQRVVRGGSYRDGPEKVRPGAREHLDAATRDDMTGFRLVRELRAP